MITQNTIALIIVFAAAAISIYSVVKSLVSKKASKCDGCAGCAFKNKAVLNSCESTAKKDFTGIRMMPTNIKQFN